MNTRVGVIHRPDVHPAALRGIARAAEAAGVDDLWFWEDCFQQGGIAQVAVALASTERLRVGVGLIPAPLRNVAAAAMEFATLDAMFPGRTQIAVGHGVQSWMRQAGAAVESPLTLLREYVIALQRLLSGETVSVEGRYVRLSGVRLEFPPASRPPVLMGGTGPKTLRLAGEIADGVVVDSRYSARTLREALGHVAAGRADVGETPFTTVLFLACVPGDDSARRLAAEAVSHDIPAGDLFGVGGTAEQIAAGLAPYLEAGVDTIALQPLSSLEAMADFIATAGAACADARGV